MALAAGAAASPYGKWVAQGSTFTEIREQPPPLGQVRLRLICVPPAGMGGACYHGWTKGLPDSVEVMPLDLPARGGRMGEDIPYARSLGELACHILDGLSLEVLAARPFALFGHSFGAWVVFEMCQELLRRQAKGWPLPLKVYVSACRPPQLAALEHDPDRVNPTLGNLSEESFWEAFERRYGCNPDLQASFIREFVIKTLQADFSLLESYTPSSAERLPLPLSALCACGDDRCRPEQLSQWAQCCATAEGFQERWFEDMLLPGAWATQHRYVVDNSGPLLRFLHGDLPLVGNPVPGYAGVDGPLAPAPAASPEASPAVQDEAQADAREGGCVVL